MEATKTSPPSSMDEQRRLCPFSTFLATFSVLASTLVVVLSFPGADAQGGADPPNHPFDLGDFFALVIVTGLAFGGICACLGKYARMRAAGLL